MGNEENKNGISIKELPKLYEHSINEFGFIIGLMCLPPKDGSASDYFKELKNLNINLNLKELSMGMSQDYIEAASIGATYLRIGSSIFGSRI